MYEFVLVLSRSKLINKQFFAQHDPRLVNNIVKFAVVLFKYFVVIGLVCFIFVVFQILYVQARIAISVFGLILLVEELLQYVLNLLFELVVGLVH